MDTDRRSQHRDNPETGEQTPSLRLPEETLEQIRALAGVDGLSAEEMVGVAVLAYAVLTPERRLRLVVSWREAHRSESQLKQLPAHVKKATPDVHKAAPHTHKTGREALVEAFDKARDMVVAEMRQADLPRLETDEEILEEAVRLTREAGKARARTFSGRD